MTKTQVHMVFALLWLIFGHVASTLPGEIIGFLGTIIHGSIATFYAWKGK